MTRLQRLLLSAAVVLTTACGGSAASRIKPTGPREAPQLDPVKPAALKEFDAAMREQRRGGDDAIDTVRDGLKAAVKLDGTLWEAWHNLGVLDHRAGDYEDAVAAFDKALAVNPSHVPSRLARAEAYRADGNDKAAQADYEAVLRELAEDDPLRNEAAARLASHFRDDGDYTEAISVLRETLRVAGESSRVYTELGMVYVAQKRLDLAALVLSKAAEIDAKDPAVANAQALLAMARGDAQLAFERFDAATSLDPNYIDARYNKAHVLLDAGDYARAKVELATLLERRPADLSAKVALGIAQRGLGDLPAALATWDAVIERAPRRSTVRGDALFNRAILKADFMEDVAAGKADLERFLQDAPKGHRMRAAAVDKQKELGL